MWLATLLTAIIDFFIYGHSPIWTFLAGPWSVHIYDVDCTEMECHILLLLSILALTNVVELEMR